MSDTDSTLSADSDIYNVSHFFNHFEFDYEHDSIESSPFDTDDSSGSESNLINRTDSSSSNVRFQSPYLIYFNFNFIILD